MAEILGIVGSVASLVALAQETTHACNRLAKFVRLYKNASSDIEDLFDELSDLSHTVSLVRVTLQSVHDQSTSDVDATLGLERTLAGIQKDLDTIEVMMTPYDPQSNTRKTSKDKFKWAFKEADIISAMTTIGRKKQTLLTKLSLMHMYDHIQRDDQNIFLIGSFNRDQLRAGITVTNTYESKLDQVASCLESLTVRVDTSSREASREVHRCLQPSFASLETLVKSSIHQAIKPSPQSESLTTLYAERLADQVSQTLIPSNREHVKRTLSGTNHSILTSTGKEPDEQATVQRSTMVYAPRTAISRHTESREIGSIFGKAGYRYYTCRVPLSTSQEEFSIETNMTELSFTLAPWLRAWVKRGGIVSQLTTRCPGFTFNISSPRVLDWDDAVHKPIWAAIRAGDVVTLQESFRKRLAYPTDVNARGESLLSVS